jgi:glutathione gamma-glutamylcysteinyltransferase
MVCRDVFVSVDVEENFVVSYSRKAFSQTVDGHFRPVGGYHAARDLVLIPDTVSASYGCHVSRHIRLF